MIICDNCIMAIRSRGEKVIEIDTVEFEDNDGVCQWCKEDGFYELIEIK